MSLNPPDGQSAGWDPKTKRNSGLLSFFKWFKPASSSYESSSSSSSCASLASLQSTGTVASFSYVAPSAYTPIAEKTIHPGPETDTYKARLKQRDKRRESDKNVTLRKKYNLFFNREKIDSKSLPLMPRGTMQSEPDDELLQIHRRTTSESSKIKKAGAYLHVKGKRKAPQPPSESKISLDSSTMSLRRKNKRLAPAPPPLLVNDSLKLEHGILKAATDVTNSSSDQNSSTRSEIVTPVSPRPWYKRSNQKKQDLEAVEEKRKSGLAFLTNISELDREAAELIKSQKSQHPEMPEFMRPKEEAEVVAAPSKRRSARDLIAKFNAITNVKVTVFGVPKEGKFFGKQISLDEGAKRQEVLLDAHRKRIEKINNNNSSKDNLNKLNVLMKSESASAVKLKAETPKLERKSWKCPKCNLENEYWRIICHVCSAIKPYFDDFAPAAPKVAPAPSILDTKGVLERSKTQIGFSALASYNNNNNKKEDKLNVVEIKDKKEEREKLKRMLIEMKNSLPKRKSNMLNKQASRTSIIMENPEDTKKEAKIEPVISDQEQKVASILIGTTQTIYENIKIKKSAPIKSSSANNSANESSDDKLAKIKVIEAQKAPSILKTETKLLDQTKTKTYEPMKAKDFDNIYSDKNNPKSAAKIYANLAQNDELSLFFNMPKKFNEIKNSVNQTNNTDTIEINRLLRRLETSIAKGELTEASIFAKELAQLKINCSVIRQKPQGAGGSSTKTGFAIEMFVEDKISHRGPFAIQVTETQTVAQLKKQVEKEFEIPVDVQRWILGKELATNEEATLKDHNITTEGCPVFLYLVAPEAKVNHVPKIVDVIPKNEAGSSRMADELQKAIKKTEEMQNVLKVKKEEKLVERKIEGKIEDVVRKEENLLQKNTKVEILTKEPPKKKDEILPELKFAAIVSLEAKQPTKEELPVKIEQPPAILKPARRDKSTPNAPKAKIEEDFDSKTLTPSKEWECHLCTLLNPLTSNICAVCATVRQINQNSSPKKKKKAPQPQAAGPSEQTYLQLVNLDNADLVETRDTFECLVCFLEIPPKRGVTLRECLHQFCKVCLAHTIEYTEEAEVKCPYRDNDYSCNIALQAREIKALVKPAIYEQFLAKSMTQAENKSGKSFHCKTPDCRGWCFFEDNVNEFRCPVCRHVNCLTCQAIHMGLNCKQYQEKMTDESEIDEDAKRTKEMLDEMVNKGEALTCPTCKVVLMKKWGCDWLRCSMCKTEICWVTRGPRWGPAGKGDTSGGCQCGLKGVKCHPQCNYCH